MKVTDPGSVKQLVASAQALHALGLHERLSNSDGFLIRSPKLDGPAVVVLMGNGGQAFGLNVFLGSSALATFRAMMSARGEAQAHRAMMRSRLLGYEMRPAGRLSHDARRWLKKAKIPFEARAWYPDPMSLEPGKKPVMVLTDSQTRLLLHLVRGILAASRDAAFEPCGFDGAGRMLCVEMDDAIAQPKAKIAWGAVASEEAPEVTASAGQGADAEPVAARFDLAGLPRSGDHWLVTLLPVPGSIRGDDRQPFMLVVASEQTGGLFPALVMSAEPAAVVDALAVMMRGEAERPPDGGDAIEPPPAGLPEHLVLDGSDLCEACRCAFGPFQVACFDGSNRPDLQGMIQDLRASFSAGLGVAEDDDPAADAEAIPSDGLAGVPSAHDLDGWKRADAWLKRRLFTGFDHDTRFRGVRALRQYFGPDADPMALFERFMSLMVVDSYAFWFAARYRSAKHRPTLAEQWLDEDQTPEAVKLLLRAIAARGPSLYRIEEADEDTGKLTLTDVFTGELTIATDFALSTCVEPGWLLPALLVPAGAFHLYYPVGPILNSSQLHTALDSFNDQRIAPLPQALRDQPHALGRLWHAVDQARQRPIELRNTDGHPLLLHTAVFRCPKPKPFARALARQRDIEPDGDSTRDWIWFRPGTGRVPKGMPQNTKLVETYQEATVGRVTLLAEFHLDPAGRLTLKVNSQQRFDAARDRLEKLGPLELVSCETQTLSIRSREADTSDPNPSNQDSPDEPDPQIADLDPELLNATRDYLLDHYRDWLDQPLPALNGQTPRQAARKPKLRPQLAAMIRAMPDPVGPRNAPAPLHAPRQMLLAELGLA